MTNLLSELEWRGLLYDRTERLADALAAGSVTGYCGFDPTADSLHVGSLVQIMGLLHLQRAGHRPVALLGGGTGLIGDPSGKATERPLLDSTQIAANAQAIRAQLERFLDFSGPRGALMRDNSEWLVPLPTLSFLRDVGKHFSINFMLAKDSVKSRLDGGISFTEFAYMLLQAYDFLELYRRDGVTLQTGGSDQWGNITDRHRIDPASGRRRRPWPRAATRDDGERDQVREDRSGRGLAGRDSHVAVPVLPVLGEHR